MLKTIRSCIRGKVESGVLALYNEDFDFRDAKTVKSHISAQRKSQSKI